MSAKVILLLIYCFILECATIAVAENLTPGVKHESITVAPREIIDIILIEKQAATARALSSLSTSNAKTYGFNVASSMTISDYYYDANPIAVISGGFLKSFSPPTALGMLIINKRQISRENPTWLGGGMFCADDQKYFVGRFDATKALT
jgi:hypothetical protein